MAEYRIDIAPQPVALVETSHRVIRTDIPAPGTEAVFDNLLDQEPRSMHAQLPIVWEKAEGHSVFDFAGNKWIDFTSTIFVANIGHANPRLISALKAATDAQLLHSYTYPSRLRSDYIQKLLDFAGPGFDKAFLLSSGTEAVEAAIKLMRMNGQRAGKRRLGIISLEGNYHGRTMGAQLATGNTDQAAWIGSTDLDFHHLPFPYPWHVNDGGGADMFHRSMDALRDRGIDPKKDICGVLLETFQGWGAIFYPQDYVSAVAEFCHESGAVFAFDEMQAGFARTGKRFGYEHYDVSPDLICTGKGMGSGLPLSGVIGRHEILDMPNAGDMSSTHSANPLCCAAGLETIREIERLDLVAETARKGDLLHAALGEIQRDHSERIGYVCGTGLIAALIFRHPQTGEPDGAFASQVSEKCMQKGLLVVHTGRESIKIGPPLTIPDDALYEGAAVIAEAISEVTGEVA